MGGGVVLNIKYKRIFKLFFFVVIFFVLLGLCATTKTYAAYAVKNVFPSCSTGGKIGFIDDITGDSGVVQLTAKWATAPAKTEKTKNTTWKAYRNSSKKIHITQYDKQIGNIKIHVNDQTISTVTQASIPGITDKPPKNDPNNKYIYAVIPIEFTVPAGYFFNHISEVVGTGTVNGETNSIFEFAMNEKGIKNELPLMSPVFTSCNQERTSTGYLIVNTRFLGLITQTASTSYNSGNNMLQNSKNYWYRTLHFQYMPYKVEYAPGANSTGSSYIDKKYAGKTSTLRGETYSRKHYHQTGWKGYSQYAILSDDKKTATQGKHNEEYNLNQSVSFPYSPDGVLRKIRTIKHDASTWTDGDNAGCKGITETTESKIVLEPRWEADNYTIKYDPNGGKLKSGVTEADCTQKVKYNTRDKLRDYEPYIENPYGRFKGWSTDPTGTRILQPGSSIDNIDVENNGNITLYAIWETEFTIYFDTMNYDGTLIGKFPDGTDWKPTIYKYGDILTSIDSSLIPELPGYRFVGFYTVPGMVEGKGDDYEQKVFDSKGSAVDSNITNSSMIIKNGQLLPTEQSDIDLYAKYTKITDASCSEDSATIPNIPVNPPSENGGPASENLHLKILKKDQNTEELLDGAIFTLQGAGDNSDFSVERTTVYGVANFDLSNAKAGEYKLTETKAPDGYKTSDSTCPWTFTLEVNTVTDSKGVKHEIRRIKGIKDKNGEKVNTPTLTDDSYNCTIYNISKKQTLKITKKDSKTGEPLTGAVFRLTGSNGYNEERHVDTSGVVKFEDLEPGDYELKETTVPVGYMLSGKIYAVKVTENDVTITEK